MAAPNSRGFSSPSDLLQHVFKIHSQVRRAGNEAAEIRWGFPTARCEAGESSAEEPVDLKAEIEESCKPKCVKAMLSYEACVKRIADDETGEKHCTGQYFDYWGCIDKCAAKKVFEALK